MIMHTRKPIWQFIKLYLSIIVTNFDLATFQRDSNRHYNRYRSYMIEGWCLKTFLDIPTNGFERKFFEQKPLRL